MDGLTPKLETVLVFVSERVDRQTVLCLYNIVLLSSGEEQTIDACSNLD